MTDENPQKKFDEINGRIKDLISEIHRNRQEHREQIAGISQLVKDTSEPHPESHNRILAVTGRIAELEILLLGDRDKRQIYETAKKGNVWPNIVEPPPGALEIINTQLESLHEVLGAITKSLDTRFEIVTKLSAFFGPMLVGKNPPLDGNLIASKEYVDKGIERFAGAIREEVALAKDLARSIKAAFGTIADAARELRWVYTREDQRRNEEAARAKRPSRVQSLIYAVTGHTPPKNGAER